ncbi:MAG: GTP-binding protein [Candidatus Heimdallarchaeota archaeon]
MSSHGRSNTSSSKKTVVAICNRCKEKLRINIELEEIKQSLKGGLCSLEVPHGDLNDAHSTIFYLSLSGDRVQIRGQVTADSIAESIRASSSWDINMEQAETIDQLLKNFIGVVSGVEMIVISDRDGKTTGLKSVAGIGRMRIAQIEKIITQILTGVAKSFKATPMGTSVFEMGDLRIVFVRGGPLAIITVCSTMTVSTESVLAYTYLTAEKLSEILEGHQVTVEIPLLEISESIEPEEKVTGIRYLKVVPDKYLAKLTLVGNESVGKTSIVRRYVKNTFKKDYKPTIGINIMSKTVKFPDQETRVKFSIHDLGGQEQFARVRKSYFRGAHACFIVCDVTDRASFEAVKDWYQETLDYAGLSTIILIIGNKVDLVDQRVVETEEAVELAHNLGCTYFETSAKTGENVAAAFSVIALFLVERMERRIKGEEPQKINLEEYLKGRAFPAKMMDEIITLIAEFEPNP